MFPGREAGGSVFVCASIYVLVLVVMPSHGTMVQNSLGHDISMTILYFKCQAIFLLQHWGLFVPPHYRYCSLASQMKVEDTQLWRINVSYETIS